MPYIDANGQKRDGSNDPVLSRQIDRAVAAEREACAGIADTWARTAFGRCENAVKYAASDIAATIRKRTQRAAMKPISLPPDDPNAPQVADLAQRLSDTIGTTHSDVVFPALAAVFVATLARLPDASPDQALRAFETNVRGLISINRPRE